MFRKLWYGVAATLIVALVAGLSVSGIAFASGPGTINRTRSSPANATIGHGQLYAPRLVSGQVVEVWGNGFSIRTRQGQELTFGYNVDTRFENAQKQAMKVSDLKAGTWVTVYASHADQYGLDGGYSKFIGRSMVAGHQRYSAPRADMDDTFASLVIVGTQKAAASAPQAKPAPATSPVPATAPAPKPSTAPAGTYPAKP